MLARSLARAHMQMHQSCFACMHYAPGMLTPAAQMGLTWLYGLPWAKQQPAPLPRLPQAVRVYGSEVQAVQLTEQQAASGFWYVPPVPSLLGVPLAIHRLEPKLPPPRDERIAVLMAIDPVDGLAPEAVQCMGWGQVLLARTDGVDLAPDEVVSKQGGGGGAPQSRAAQQV